MPSTGEGGVPAPAIRARAAAIDSGGCVRTDPGCRRSTWDCRARTAPWGSALCRTRPMEAGWRGRRCGSARTPCTIQRAPLHRLQHKGCDFMTTKSVEMHTLAAQLRRGECHLQSHTMGCRACVSRTTTRRLRFILTCSATSEAVAVEQARARGDGNGRYRCRSATSYDKFVSHENQVSVWGGADGHTFRIIVTKSISWIVALVAVLNNRSRRGENAGCSPAPAAPASGPPRAESSQCGAEQLAAVRSADRVRFCCSGAGANAWVRCGVQTYERDKRCAEQNFDCTEAALFPLERTWECGDGVAVG